VSAWWLIPAFAGGCILGLGIGYLLVRHAFKDMM